jgi:hypothetical protein
MWLGGGGLAGARESKMALFIFYTHRHWLGFSSMEFHIIQKSMLHKHGTYTARVQNQKFQGLFRSRPQSYDLYFYYILLVKANYKAVQICGEEN